MADNDTLLVSADKLVTAFNATTERAFWSARMAGTGRAPLVRFASRSSMVELTYYPDGRFLVNFNKVSCVWGDYMYAIHNAIHQVMSAAKAAGLAMPAPLDDDDGVVRIEYDPVEKQTWATLAKLADDWDQQQENAFKVLM